MGVTKTKISNLILPTNYNAGDIFFAFVCDISVVLMIYLCVFLL